MIGFGKQAKDMEVKMLKENEIIFKLHSISDDLVLCIKTLARQLEISEVPLSQSITSVKDILIGANGHLNLLFENIDDKKETSENS